MKVLRDKLIELYYADTSAVRYWSIWVMLIAATGLWMRAGDPSADIALLFNIAPWWAWSGMLVILAIYRTMGLFQYGMTPLTLMLTPMLSMFIWSMLLAAAIAAPQFGLSLLFLVPAMQDTWLLSRSFLARAQRK